MMCSQCRILANRLTEVYATSTLELSFQPSQRLCDECLVGRTVPIYRPQVHQWQVGDIDEFDRKTGMHHFIFPDNEEEWLKVEATPYTSYLNHHKSQLRQRDMQPQRSSRQGAAEPKSMPPRIHVDERDDVNVFDTPETRNELDDPMYHNTAPWRFGRGKQPHPSFHPEASTPVPDSIWVEQPRMTTTMMMYPHEAVPAHVRHWTWPSFGFGGTQRVHPGQVVPAPHSMVMHYDATHRRLGEDYPTMMSHSQIVEAPKKSCPRFWTVEEDNLLLTAVDARGGQDLVKWPAVAKCIPGRTGKQCRERYMNHLKPRVKLHRWSAVEDSLAFSLFQSIGSKWAMISKFIPGRTDNGVKNRVHFLKRRLDQHLAHIRALGNGTLSHVDSNANYLNWENPKNEEQWETLRKLYLLLLSSTHDLKSSSITQGDFRSIMSEYSFGPFRSLEQETAVSCVRCRLMMPSEQTGRSVCETTGWCIMCTKLPTYLSGFVLAKFLTLSSHCNRPQGGGIC